MQVILGSSGIIGKEVAKELHRNYTKDIRLVARNPRAVNSTDVLFKADLTDEKQTFDAVKGCDVAYLTVGLTYSSKVWAEQWPVIMKNVIAACKSQNTSLVFFDNVYSYGLVEGAMNEETPYRPCSRKGKVRAGIAETLMDEVNKGNLKALIARAPDFYGPDTPLSFVSAMVFDNLAKGKKAQWLGDPDRKHSFIFTPDAGKATATLGNTPSAFNQVWHLPTVKEPITGRDFVQLATEEFGKKTEMTVVKKWMVQMIGLFNPLLKESVEMMYQNENDYIFDSGKFIQAFSYKPVTYKEGIKETVNFYKSSS
jgi:nucleoside-diphosphate-sugar epimerase